MKKKQVKLLGSVTKDLSKLYQAFENEDREEVFYHGTQMIMEMMRLIQTTQDEMDFERFWKGCSNGVTKTYKKH